ncbi:hypothetical protein ACIQ7D_10320 [Streptomyces sp. NPDC096310]
MALEMQIATSISPLFGSLTVLFAVALIHPEPQVRARAERLLKVIFHAR